LGIPETQHKKSKFRPIGTGQLDKTSSFADRRNDFAEKGNFESASDYAFPQESLSGTNLLQDESSRN